ncbi:hydantoinase B/oxoprolinase family protein [Phenylobacterium sp.]|jgi:N-methylhydantoinase B|uniref:hydantoinase B/oxoprolinase family protein n=1 Tax=Phenylobacterium sp. TaxID=1871053 RepID=UPI00378311C0
MKLDLTDYAVITQALLATSREMGAKLIQSAYSTIVREARDCSAALLDRRGNVVAQAELIPIQLGSMAATFAPCAELYPLDELEEGDFFVNNDPFNGGQHLQDVFIFHPIFFEKQLIGFSATTAHHLDLGGGSAGLNSEATDVHQEGLIIPPTKFNMKRDWNGGPLERIIRANIRVPHQTIGDLEGQMAANAIGIARVQQLCAKYGAETVVATMSELLDYSERRIRAAISAAPDGVYYGEDALDDDGVSDEPLVIKAKVVIAGDSIEIDFEGSCPQVQRNLNAPLASSVSAALCCVKAVLTSPDIPFNQGAIQPISVKVPPGTLLNPRYPAPVRARMEACYRAHNAVMKALAQAAPDKVTAIGFDTASILCFSRLAPQGYQVSLEVFGGGFGASSHRDGCDAVDAPLSNCSNTPIESLDMEFEMFRVTRYALLPDSCGHGEYRGGLGFVREYEVLADDVELSVYADRFRLAPDGLFGGTPGSLGGCEIVRGGEVIPMRSKGSMTLRRGDQVRFAFGGGAGYGDPKVRRRELIAADLANGVLSRELAEQVYG